METYMKKFIENFTIFLIIFAFIISNPLLAKGKKNGHCCKGWGSAGASAGSGTSGSTGQSSNTSNKNNSSWSPNNNNNSNSNSNNSGNNNNGRLFGNNPQPWQSTGFSQTAAGFTITAAPSSSEYYEVTVKGPERVWVKIKANGKISGYQINPKQFTFSGLGQHPVKTWKFSLPPATGTKITLSFCGEKTWDSPTSSRLTKTSSKQKSWISKTFPVVQKVTIPAPVVGSSNYEAITPPGIIQEDVNCSWTVDNPSDIFLKLDTTVKFQWTFPNLNGSPTIQNGTIKVDKSTTGKQLASQIRGRHTFMDAGIYDIKLNLKFTEVIQNGEKIDDIPRDYNYSKTIIVVEHIPAYIGNTLATITPPVIIQEDIDNRFLFNSMFSFTRLLPENAISLVDRFEGVEPGTVTYSIDWGDADVSSEMNYPGTDKASIGDNPNPSVKYLRIPGITHNYLEPGNYVVRLKITFMERHYEKYPIISDAGQIIGYNFKIIGPFTHIATKSITVWDQTPPVFVNGSFPDLYATSGDPLEIKLDVSDNHPDEPISSAKIHYMIYPSQWKGNDLPEEWKSMDALIELNGDQIWSVSVKINIPDDFATKNFKSNAIKDMKYLKYYLEVKDSTGNTNIGDIDIVDNHNFKNKYDANGVDFGQINVKDNDPPNIIVVLNCEQDKRIFTFEAIGGEIDFNTEPPVHGQIKKCYSCPTGSACEMISITEDPISGVNPSLILPIGFVSEDYTLREDTRIKIKWNVNDKVDGPMKLQSEKLDLNDTNVVFTTSGIKKIDFYAFDNKNPDGTANGRKLLIDFIIKKMFMSRKVLNNK